MAKIKKEKNEQYYYDKYRKIFGWLVRFVLPACFFGEEIPDGGKFLVSNHLSLFDPVITFAYVPGYKRFISKKELSNAFFIGKVFLYSLFQMLFNLFKCLYFLIETYCNMIS